jgi:polyribonucleotide nucleotidyltransferase
MQLSFSDLNLVYACTRDKTLMIDVQAREISEKDLEAGLRLAHPEVSHETCRMVPLSCYIY